MGERLHAHEVVGLRDAGKRIGKGIVDTDRHTQPHVLGRLHDAAARAHEVCLLQRLEPEVVQQEVVFWADQTIECVGVRTDEGDHIRMKSGCGCTPTIRDGCQLLHRHRESGRRILLTVRDDDLRC